MNITIFKNIHHPNNPLYVDVYEELNRIQKGDYKLIDKIRKVRSAKTITAREKAKKKLYAVCFSGEFSERRGLKLLKHSGLICLDFDNVPINEINKLKIKLRKYPWILSYFISPSGTGLKAIAHTNSTNSIDHKENFLKIEDILKSPFLDRNTLDVTRACFESFDPYIYVNKDSTPLD